MRPAEGRGTDTGKLLHERSWIINLRALCVCVCVCVCVCGGGRFLGPHNFILINRISGVMIESFKSVLEAEPPSP